MKKYRLHYLADNDDGDPKTYESKEPVKAGDVIYLEETGNYHQAIRLLQQKTGTRIDLSKSAESRLEAEQLAGQYGHVPEA
jgi:hypothetical protein